MTVVELVWGDPRRAPRPVEVVIHDPYDDSPLSVPALVLGIGVREPDEVAALLRTLGDAGASALVVRAPVALDDTVRAAAEESGVVLLALTPGAAWAQVADLLRTVVPEGDAGAVENDPLPGFPAGDLFSLANAISELVGAAVTIEDLDSRVVAFSANQDRADEPRIQTVLGRQVPEQYLEWLETERVFSELYHSDKPIYAALPGSALLRMAVAVRAGDDILGSMWAAVYGRPSPERERAFADAAKLAAVHMLRERAGADVERRLRAELVATALGGGPGGHEAARRLRIAGAPTVVLALGIGEGDAVPAAWAEAERQRVSDALALHLATTHPRSASALIGGVAYGILPVGGEAGDLRAERVAAEFLGRATTRLCCAFGIGRIATSVAELAQSRRDADRALRVIRSSESARRIARISEVYATALLLELSDLVAAETAPPQRPLALLLKYDEEHDTDLIPSLCAWLDAFGDVKTAADAVHVHPSTFRYRLRRVVEISGLDLRDQEQRFAAMLQLRLLPTIGPSRR
ncbi:PucR family transcriptional regulator [Spirillospora sp. NPDC048823]|uniref:PucR family transcriptional regulator n=1 Tax=unclassified Spirillospora TaxID=2642701 RepID=UPI0037215198